MNFDIKFADDEKVVRSWTLSQFVFNNQPGLEVLTLTNRRLIYEKKGDRFLEKSEVPVDNVQSIKSAFTFSKTHLVAVGVTLCILGLLLGALYFIPSIESSFLSFLAGVVQYIAIGGGALFLIGVILFIIGKIKITHLLVSIEIMHNGGAISQISLPHSVSLESPVYNKQCFDMVNDLGILIMQIRDEKAKKVKAENDATKPYFQ